MYILKRHYHFQFQLCFASISLIIIWLAPRVGKMNQILRCDWLPERGEMKLSCPLWTIRRVLQRKFPQKPYNKSFIDQALFGQDDWINWPRSFLRVREPRLRLGK